MSASITIDLNSDNDELLFYINILQTVIDKNNKDKERWDNERRERRKKKTKEEILKEIDDELEMEKINIQDSNTEISNLELKRKELESMSDTKPEKPFKKVKPIKKKVSINPNEPLLVDY